MKTLDRLLDRPLVRDGLFMAALLLVIGKLVASVVAPLSMLDALRFLDPYSRGAEFLLTVLGCGIALYALMRDSLRWTIVGMVIAAAATSVARAGSMMSDNDPYLSLPQRYATTDSLLLAAVVIGITALLGRRAERPKVERRAIVVVVVVQSALALIVAVGLTVLNDSFTYVLMWLAVFATLTWIPTVALLTYYWSRHPAVALAIALASAGTATVATIASLPDFGLVVGSAVPAVIAGVIAYVLVVTKTAAPETEAAALASSPEADRTPTS